MTFNVTNNKNSRLVECMILNKDIKPGFEKLENDLRSLAKPQIPLERSEKLKKNLMQKIDLPVAEYLREARFSMDSSLKAKLKERIFALIEDRSQKRFFWLYLFDKKFVSAFVLMALFFGVFGVKGVETRVVNAETFTVLDSFSGEVEVVREGTKLEVFAKMKIFENDKVITGHEATATIRFFDDSVARLADDTQVVVTKMFRPEEDSLKTYVELAVDQGIVWSRVVNLVERGSSFVVTAGDVTTLATKGAFNVDVNSESVKVGVFNNAVDVQTAGKNERIMTGQELVKDVDNLVYIQPIDEQKRLAGWVKDNLDNDQEYLAEVEKRLLVAKMESVGIQDGEEISFDSSLIEKTLVFLTFDDVKKKKIELDLAEKNFIAAQVKLEDPNLSLEEKEKTLVVINEFSRNVKGFYNLVDEVGHTDAEYSKELKTYVQDKVLLQKKNLSLALPNSALYDAKKIVEDLEILGAENVVEVAEVKRDQALEKLSQAQDASLKGDKEVAADVLEESKSDFAEVAQIIEDNKGSVPVREELKVRVEEDLSLVQTVDRQVTPQPVVTPDPIVTPTPTVVDPVPTETVDPLPPVEPPKVEDDKVLPPQLQ